MEIRKLNTLRGIAALIVLISHYSNATNLFHGVLGTGGGQFGVMLFFLLSGFLMSYLYLAKEFNRDTVHSYIIARIARVLPLFLILVSSSFILQQLGILHLLYKIPHSKDFLSHILLLHGESVLWTIPVEIHFYFLFIFIWWLWNKGYEMVYIFMSLLLVIIIFIDYKNFEGNLFGVHYNFVLMRCLPYFFMGLIFGQLYHHWNPQQYLISRLFILSLLCVPLLYPKIFFYLTGYNHEMWKDLEILFIVSLIFFFFIFLTPENDRLLANRVGDFLGKISYSLYLLHIPILWKIKPLASNNPELVFFLFIILSIFISYLSYLLIEKPSRAYLKQRICRRR